MTQKDCIQWVMETSPKQHPWSAERIVHELMALWFGSVHVLSTTICFTVHDLCLRPEYIEPLLKELESPEWANFERTGKGLPLLDSFLKESIRTTPVESMSTRRQALEPFILSGGVRVEIGEWICTPVRAMMRDAANYAEPLEFHGFRFVNLNILEGLNDLSNFQVPKPAKPSELTDLVDWQVWGTGRMACNDIDHSSQRSQFNMSAFTLRHIPPLFVATALTFGGLIPFFNAEYAILEFGLPKRIAVSKPAQSIMILSSARISAIGIALFTFYFQGKYTAVDTVLATLGYVGLVDGYVCWCEGVPNKAVFRFLSGVLISAWGWLGMTAGN
ncbi:hypothetical protein NHQ30_006995 [Ciborinia camelliae]|nr:hypothetical protein NHQ30_006995 [Ciborinia camelliae]